MAATLVLGLAVGWFGREALLDRAGHADDLRAPGRVRARALHRRPRRPVEVWAHEEKSLVTWLTRRIGVQVARPRPQRVGYALVGGRLLAGNEKPTALLMYENADKQRLTLQWRKDTRHVGATPGGTGDTAFRYAIENGVGVFYWIDDDCAYALSGNLDRTQLLAVARVVYGQLAALDAIEHAPVTR